MKFNESQYRQRRIAMLCASASSLRGQGPAGMIKSTRKFLARVHLEKFNELDGKAFNLRLNSLTRRLMRRFPMTARTNWGAARKVLNLFLRDALYDHHLNVRYSLHQIEPYLEVPLDRDVAEGLRSEREGGQLPPRFKIKTLTPQASKQYQDFAQRVAENKKNPTPRVHLDLLYWRKKESSD